MITRREFNELAMAVRDVDYRISTRPSFFDIDKEMRIVDKLRYDVNLLMDYLGLEIQDLPAARKVAKKEKK